MFNQDDSAANTPAYSPMANPQQTGDPRGQAAVQQDVQPEETPETASAQTPGTQEAPQPLTIETAKTSEERVIAASIFILQNAGMGRADRAIVFQDKYVFIEAYIAPDGKGLAEIHIRLDIPAPSTSSSLENKSFFVPKSDEENLDGYETLVFHWNPAVQYFRTGRWENYLIKLVNDLKEKFKKVRELNGTPVDDVASFPDLDLPTPPTPPSPPTA